MNTPERLLELADECQRTHDVWMALARSSVLNEAPGLIEAYRRREAAEAAFTEALRVALSDRR